MLEILANVVLGNVRKHFFAVWREQLSDGGGTTCCWKGLSDLGLLGGLFRIHSDSYKARINNWVSVVTTVTNR